MEEWIACDSPPLSHETLFSDIEQRGEYVFSHLGIAPSDAFSTDFSFVNFIEHKVKKLLDSTVIGSTKVDANPWLGRDD